MAIHQPNLAYENQRKSLKLQGYCQKANGISFWAFLFSIFIYISVFYIFNLFPSSILNTTKFWFFISNTLILIIAADFGASKKQAEIYDEYVEKSRGNVIRFPSSESRYPEREIVKTSIPPQKVKDSQETQEVLKEVAFVDVARESESMVDETQVVLKDDVKVSTEDSQVDFPPKEESEEEVEEEEVEQEQEDEFSKMSDEEVNRRVEEFIQRFNRQIRLQAAQNRIQQIQRGHFAHQTSLVK